MKSFSAQYIIIIVPRLYYCRELLSGMVYLHLNKIAHRDLKPDNILVTIYHRVFYDFECRHNKQYSYYFPFTYSNYLSYNYFPHMC